MFLFEDDNTITVHDGAMKHSAGVSTGCIWIEIRAIITRCKGKLCKGVGLHEPDLKFNRSLSSQWPLKPAAQWQFDVIFLSSCGGHLWWLASVLILMSNISHALFLSNIFNIVIYKLKCTCNKVFLLGFLLNLYNIGTILSCHVMSPDFSILCLAWNPLTILFLLSLRTSADEVMRLNDVSSLYEDIKKLVPGIIPPAIQTNMHQIHIGRKVFEWILV